MTIDAELAPFIEGLQRAWPEYPLSLDVAAWRARAEQLSKAAAKPYPPGMSVHDRELPGPGRTVPVRIYRPEAPGPLPVLIYMHGGGWVIGSHDTHDGITAALAAQTPAVVVNVHYARAPEHRYPAAVEDCRAVVEWAFAHAEEIGGRADAIFTGGDSAGGNLATVMALALRDSPQHRLRGQVLIYPCVDTDFSRPSYISEAQAPFLKAAEMIWFWGQYCPDPVKRREPFATPIHAPDFSGMPPALVTVAEHDPLRDEGREYAERLQQAGVPVRFRPGKGLIHGHLRAGGFCAAAKAEFDAICAWIHDTANPAPDS